MPHLPIPPIAISKLATTADQIHLAARILLQQHKAMVLAYNNAYDIVKYNFLAPVSQSEFETHKLKWNFIELAKYLETAKGKPNEIQSADFHVFCNMIYGEGYREPEMFKVSWLLEIQSGRALNEIFFAYLQEEKNRYQILESSLHKMRATHDIQSISEFKTFISPVVTPKFNTVEPPMWNAIGYSPVQRGNRTYSLSIESFFLVDSVLHLLDKWDEALVGEPSWDSHVKRLRAYRKIYSHMFPINSMLVRQAINSTMNFPKN